jgi:hypothetical protein
MSAPPHQLLLGDTELKYLSVSPTSLWLRSFLNVESIADETYW